MATDVGWGELDEPGRVEVVAPDAVFREPGQLLDGREAFRERMGAFKAASPDLRVTVDDLVADADKAAVRWTPAPTHQAAFGPYPPTGRSVTMSGIAVFRVVDGQVVEGWGCFDTLSAMQQLGATVTMPGRAR